MDDRLFSLIHTSSLRQLQLVLECGCDIDCQNGRHETPLMAAMVSIDKPVRRQAVVQLLLQYGANVNSRNLRGQTPLIYASVMDQLDSLDLLMNCRTLNYNIQDFEGNTALMYACSMGNIEIVKELVDAHSNKRIQLDFDVTNNEGFTALLYARDCLYDDIVQVLLSSMDDKSSVNQDMEPKQKTTSRIKQLADNIESSVIDNVSEADTNAECDKNEPESKTDSPVRGCRQRKQSDEAKAGPSKDKTDVTVRAPKAKDDCVKTLLDMADISQEEIKSIIDLNENFVKEAVNFPNKTDPASTNTLTSKQKSSHKRKGKKRKSMKQSETTDISLFDKPINVQNYLTDGFAASNSTYPMTVGNSSDIMEDDVTIIRRVVMDHAKRELYKTLNIERNQPFMELDTGKIDCLNLAANEKAKLLGRTVWSVYGAPLPPIPIDNKTLKRVVDAITDVRKYLGRAKYQEGRLVTLDPELWCIIESMKLSE